MSTLAESAGQFVNSWPAVTLAIVGVVGGWGTLIIQAWISARKNSATGDTVKEIKEQGSAAADTVNKIKDQVVNGHTTNLRDDVTNLRGDVTEGLELMRFAVEFIKQLPNRDDINRIDGRIDTLTGRVAALEQLGGGFSGGRRTE